MSKQARQKQRRRKKRLLRNQQSKELNNGTNPSSQTETPEKETDRGRGIFLVQ